MVDLTEKSLTDAVLNRPLFYVKDMTIFQRPVSTEKGVRMGFAVCDVRDGVDPAAVCAILNKGEPADSGS